jgi:hypothetical protein
VFLSSVLFVLQLIKHNDSRNSRNKGRLLKHMSPRVGRSQSHCDRDIAPVCP